MEFLKELFSDGQALTYEQLAQAAKDKGFTVVNAAGGAYVPKAEHDLVTGQLSEAYNRQKARRWILDPSERAFCAIWSSGA